MNQDELIEKCLAEILNGAKDYHQEIRRALVKAIPIIQKAERERIKFAIAKIIPEYNLRMLVSDGNSGECMDWFLERIEQAMKGGNDG